MYKMLSNRIFYVRSINAKLSSPMGRMANDIELKCFYLMLIECCCETDMMRPVVSGMELSPLFRGENVKDDERPRGGFMLIISISIYLEASM